MPDLRLLQGFGGGQSSAFGPQSDAGLTLGEVSRDRAHSVPTEGLEVTVADPLVQAVQEMALKYSTLFDAAERQTMAARSLESAPRFGADASIADTLAATLDPIEHDVIANLGSVSDEVFDGVHSQVRGQREGLEEILRGRSRQSALDQISSEVLPSLMKKIRESTGNDPRRAGEVFAACEQLVEEFAPFIGEDVAEDVGLRAEMEGAREIAESALKKGDFDGLSDFLEREDNRLGDAARDELQQRLNLHREGDRSAVLGRARRLEFRLSEGGFDVGHEIESLRETTRHSGDAELRHELQAIEESLRFRKLSPAEKDSELHRLSESSPDEPRLQQWSRIALAERKLISRDPVEAARQSGVIALPVISFANAEMMGEGPAVIRNAFAARRRNGGPLRFMTNRQREEIVSEFSDADVEAQLGQLQVLQNTFGSFAEDMRAEIKPVSPVMWMAGKLVHSDRQLGARQLLDGRRLLLTDPAFLKSSRIQIRDQIRQTLKVQGHEIERFDDAVIAEYAGEIIRRGDTGVDQMDRDLVEKAVLNALQYSNEADVRISGDGNDLRRSAVTPPQGLKSDVFQVLTESGLEQEIRDHAGLALRDGSIDPGEVDGTPVKAALRRIQRSVGLPDTGEVSEGDAVSSFIATQWDALLSGLNLTVLQPILADGLRAFSVESGDSNGKVGGTVEQSAVMAGIRDPREFANGVIDLLLAILRATSGYLGRSKPPLAPKSNDGGIRG